MANAVETGPKSANKNQQFFKKYILKKSIEIEILSLGSESPSLITSLQGGMFHVLRNVRFLEAGCSGSEMAASPIVNQFVRCQYH